MTLSPPSQRMQIRVKTQANVASPNRNMSITISFLKLNEHRSDNITRASTLDEQMRAWTSAIASVTEL
jgi:hypothetical protein